jgi:stage III sporulation protein AB
MMEWLKWSGGLLVFLASAFIGFYRAALLAKRVRWIRATLHALQRLETEISFRGTLLIDALRHISRESAVHVHVAAHQRGHDFFQQLLPLLDRPGAEQTSVHSLDLRDCWQRAVEQQLRGVPAKSEELEILRQLGRSLGTSDRQDQVKHLRLAASQLHETLACATAEQTKYQSVWRSFGMLGGALLVILLY